MATPEFFDSGTGIVSLPQKAAWNTLATLSPELFDGSPKTISYLVRNANKYYLQTQPRMGETLFLHALCTTSPGVYKRIDVRYQNTIKSAQTDEPITQLQVTLYDRLKPQGNEDKQLSLAWYGRPGQPLDECMVNFWDQGAFVCNTPQSTFRIDATPGLEIHHGNIIDYAAVNESHDLWILYHGFPVERHWGSLFIPSVITSVGQMVNL